MGVGVVVGSVDSCVEGCGVFFGGGFVIAVCWVVVLDDCWMFLDGGPCDSEVLAAALDPWPDSMLLARLVEHAGTPEFSKKEVLRISSRLSPGTPRV